MLRPCKTTCRRRSANDWKLRSANEFFCGPTFQPGGDCDDVTFVIKKVDLPESVVAVVRGATQLARSVSSTEQNNTAAPQEEARGIQALEPPVCRAPDYVLLTAIE